VTNTRDTEKERKQTNNRKRSERSKQKFINSKNISINHMISERPREETSDCITVHCKIIFSEGGIMNATKRRLTEQVGVAAIFYTFI
jgi:hypothetical protein